MKFLKPFVLVLLGVLIALWISYPYHVMNDGPYYFACLKKGEKEFVVKTEKRPTISEGVVTFEDETVWFPPADTYCRTVKVSTVEDTAQSAP